MVKRKPSMEGYDVKKKIWTAEEEMRGVPYLIIFSVVWYVLLINMIISGGFHSSLLIFFLAGVMPVYQTVRVIRTAVSARRFHRQCMQENRPQQGRIVNITREYQYGGSNSGSTRGRIIYYYLTVEITDPVTGMVQTVKSAPYRVPLHRYLSSPVVQVYTDRSGWKHVIDGFQLKSSRNEPGILEGNPNISGKDFEEAPLLIRLIPVLILLIILLRILGILRS